MKFRDFIKPKWKHSDCEVRLCAVCRMTNQKLLEQIARDGYQPNPVRCAAVERLKDQETAAEIACGRYTSETLGAAVVSRLVGEVYLAKVAKSWNWPQKSFHWTALERIQSQDVLADVAIHASRMDIAEKASERVIEFPVLCRIAINRHISGVVHRIDDQGMLEEIAWKAESDITRQEAAERLVDENILAQLAIEAPGDPGCWLVRKTAVEKIQSQELLAQILIATKHVMYSYVKGEGDMGVVHVYYDPSLKVAVSKVDTPVLLSEIALQASKEHVRLLTLTCIDDQDVLAQVALEDLRYKVREVAVRKLVDENLLARIAKTDKEMRVAEAATEGIRDNALLYDLVKTSSPITQCPGRRAINRITDPKILAEIATTSDVTNYRCNAVVRITETKLVTKIAETDPNPLVRKYAAQRLEELSQEE